MKKARPPLRSGERFGQLITIARVANERKWTCLCDCGAQSVVWASHLSNGRTRSCGCGLRKHGHTADGKPTPTYKSWGSMRGRCLTPSDPSYAKYGGRGITICSAWEDYKVFLAEMGERPSLMHSIERIDVNGPYCPSNCKWATATEQARNQRNTVRLTLGGVTKPLAQWADELGIPEYNIRSRIRHGWSVSEALTTPVQKYTRRAA